MDRTITLSADEALMLLDWLQAHGEAGDLPHDAAQQQALWVLEAALEKAVSEPFDPNYAQLLAEAKARLNV